MLLGGAVWACPSHAIVVGQQVHTLCKRLFLSQVQGKSKFFDYLTPSMDVF